MEQTPDPGRGCGSLQDCLRVFGKLLAAAVAGWAALVVVELVLLFGAIPLLGMLMGSDLLAPLKVVLDLGALAACGWVAGRAGRPHVTAAAAVTAAGLALVDLTPYAPLNVPFLLRSIINAFGDSRYAWPLLTTLFLHAVLFRTLFIGARLSRPRALPLGLGIDR